MPPPIIRCDPPDPAFVNRVARAYGEACATLTDEMAVLVGTLVRVRAEYPRALIVPTDDARIEWATIRDVDRLSRWLVSGDAGLAAGQRGHSR
jgi:hypothetical protein